MITRSARLMPRLGLSASVPARVLNLIGRYKPPRTLDMLNHRLRQVLDAEMQGGLRVKFQRMGDCGTNGALMTDNDNVFTLVTLRKLVKKRVRRGRRYPACFHLQVGIQLRKATRMDAASVAVAGRHLPAEDPASCRETAR